MIKNLEELYSNLDLSGTKLAHYGIRGMQWGVRKDQIGRTSINPTGKPSPFRVLVRDDKSGNEGPAPSPVQMRFLGSEAQRAYISMGNPETIKQLRQLNENTINTHGSKISGENLKSYNDSVAKILETSANRVVKKPIIAHVYPDGVNMVLVVSNKKGIDQYKKDIQHALDDPDIFTEMITLVRDSDGFVTGVKKGNLMAQSSMSVEEFLSHVGIKGMRWGIRRSDAQLARANAASTESPDAIRAKTTLTTIRSKGSVSAVSDADLNHLINRLNTEKKFSELNTTEKKIKKQNERIKTLLDVGETMNNAAKFYHSPAGLILASKLGLPKPSGFGKHAQDAVAGRHAK